MFPEPETEALMSSLALIFRFPDPLTLALTVSDSRSKAFTFPDPDTLRVTSPAVPARVRLAEPERPASRSPTSNLVKYTFPEPEFLSLKEAASNSVSHLRFPEPPLEISSRFL